MSDTTCGPEQLDLDLQLTDGERQPTDGELFRRFRSRIVRLIGDHGVSEAVCAELRSWGQFHDFPVVASWSRRLLRKHHAWHYADASVLLTCFGISFRGDIVGHLGRDLLIAPLHSENEMFRGAAVNVLARWLEYDEDGMWHQMAEDHIGREQVVDFVDELMRAMDDEEDDSVQEVDPLLEDFFEVRRGCGVEMRGTAPILQLRPLICRLTGLEPRALGPIIEYIQFPPRADMNSVMEQVQYSHPATKHLGVVWSETGGGRILRVWDTNGSFAFSVEPTATEGRWLMFCYLR